MFRRRRSTVKVDDKKLFKVSNIIAELNVR